MARLFSIILNVLHLLQGQGRHTQDPISDQCNAEYSKVQLQVIQTTLEKIHADSEADYGLQKDILRLERKRFWIEGATLFFVIVGILGAFYSLDIQDQQLSAMHSTMQLQQRAYVNVHNIEMVSFEVGKRPVAIVSYKNSGLTPANYFIIAPDSFLYQFPTVGPIPAPPPIKEEFMSCATFKGSGPILPPGVTRTVNTSRVIGPAYAAQGELGVLTDKFIHDMRHMHAMWYVVVYVVYVDSFGHCHRSVEPFEFDIFTETFTPSWLNSVPDWIENRNAKNQPQP